MVLYRPENSSQNDHITTRKQNACPASTIIFNGDIMESISCTGRKDEVIR
jgi:hypothetical protein